MKIIKPKKLKKGDVVGVISPSSSIGSKESKRFKYCLKALDKLGLKYEIGKYANCKYDYMAAKPEERAEDINNFFADKKIKAIWCTKGGISGQLSLQYLNYDLIKKNPKIFIGYSDISNYNLALFTKSNLLNFYGPGLTTFADLLMDEKDDYYLNFTIDFLKRILFENDYNFEIEHSNKYKRFEKKYKSKGVKVITEGVETGILIGGCSPLIFNVLMGTQYFPKFPKKTILFLELLFDDPPIIEGMLWRMEELGYFKNIKGILVGKDDFKNKDCKTTSYDILKKFGDKYKIPILTDLDFGHTDPMLTMPIGAKVEINTNKKTFIIKEKVLE